MGVALVREVQRRVRRVQVLPPPTPVGQAHDRDLTEDGGERPGVPFLDGGAWRPFGVDYLLEATLGRRPQVQVALEKPAQQLTAVDIDATLELAVGERGRLGAFQESHERLEPFLRRQEGADAPLALGHRRTRSRFVAKRAANAARPASARRSSLRFSVR